MLVPAAVSASHIPFGLIRMEPVFTIPGKYPGVVAAMALAAGIDVQNVSYPALATKLRAASQVLNTPAAR